MISIITASYNAALSISSTINSVLNQTNKNWEYIIIDDGSTDNTREIIQEYNDPRISYYYQKNQGVTVARNLGIRIAKAEYIIFLDADDILYKNALENYNSYLRSNNRIGVVSGTYVHSPDIQIKARLRGEIYYNHKLNILVGSYMVSKKVLKAIGGYDEKLNYSENWELFIRLIKYCEEENYKIIHGDFLTFRYNYNGSNEKNFVRKNKIIKSYIYLYNKYKDIKNTRYNYAFSFAETIASTSFQLNKRKQAVYWQIKAINSNKGNVKAYLKYIRYFLNIKKLTEWKKK